MLTSNLVLVTTFGGLLMLEVMINDVLYWSFLIPLTINFAINIGYTQQLGQKHWGSHYFFVNFILLMACVFLMLVLGGVSEGVFNPEFFIIYCVLAEVYFFYLALKLND